MHDTISSLELQFFDGHMSALELYAALRERVLLKFPDTRIEPRKTQISMFHECMYAAVSFLPVRRAKDRPSPFLTVTFGLACRKASPRIDASAEPYPGRWTHHVTVGSVDEIDAELLSWLEEAYAFAGRRRRKHANTMEEAEANAQKICR